MREKKLEITDNSFQCLSCLEEYEISKNDIEICFECGKEICDKCYEEYGGYCEDCYEYFRKENEEDKRRLWNEFWSSRL